jgi:phosphate transport system protein
MRNRFDKELEDLNLSLIEMAGMMEDALDKAIIALRDQDAELAQSIIDGDQSIDQLERDIEAKCLRLLLHQQPVARDLRIISTALKMITDIERVGDHAADISEITLRIGKEPLVKKLEHIPIMAKEAIFMVRKSVDAFVKQDMELAYIVQKHDDIVDNLFLLIMDELIAYLGKRGENPRQAMDLLMIAKYLERVGDHAENIAEWTIFSITGEHKNQRIL